MYFLKKNSSTEAREGGTSPQNTSRSSKKTCPGKYRLLFIPREATLNIDEVLCTE